IPGMAICELLGVPYADREFFAERGAKFLSGESTHEDAAAAAVDLSNYLDRLIDQKLESPGDDLMSSLVTKHYASGAITREGVVGYGRMLLAAGFESTANAISMAVYALAVNRLFGIKGVGGV